MGRVITIRDTTLRDGHQSTRFTKPRRARSSSVPMST